MGKQNQVVKLTDKKVEYIIVSGFVAIAHGRNRGTENIDMIIERIEKDVFLKLNDDLKNAGFECMQSANSNTIYDDYLKDNLSVKYIQKGNFLPEIELKLAKDALDNYQIETKKKLLLTGLDFYFSSIEMNIAFKEQLLKSDKDIEDAQHLRIIYSDALDEKEIDKIKAMIRERYSW